MLSPSFMGLTGETPYKFLWFLQIPNDARHHLDGKLSLKSRVISQSGLTRIGAEGSGDVMNIAQRIDGGR